MNIEDRPTDMLERQLDANRQAARYRNPETGRRYCAHEPRYRPHYVREILAMRAELRRRPKEAGVATQSGQMKQNLGQSE